MPNEIRAPGEKFDRSKVMVTLHDGTVVRAWTDFHEPNTVIVKGRCVLTPKLRNGLVDGDALRVLIGYTGPSPISMYPCKTIKGAR